MNSRLSGIEHVGTRLRRPAKLSYLDEIRRFAVDCANTFGIPEARHINIELAMEEILVNIGAYAYDDEGEVEVTCRDSGEEFVVRIIDYGKRFNPLEYAEPDLTADIEERAVGGLGVFLARRMTDAVEYRREGEKNILELHFRKGPPPEPPEPTDLCGSA